MKKEIMKGEKYNRLTVIREVEPKGAIRMVKAACDCGWSGVKPYLPIKHSYVKSCGCLRRENAKAMGDSNISHGEYGTKLYKKYRNMVRESSRSGITFKDYPTFKRWAEKQGYGDGCKFRRIDGKKGFNKNNLKIIEKK